MIASLACWRGSVAGSPGVLHSATDTIPRQEARDMTTWARFLKCDLHLVPLIFLLGHGLYLFANGNRYKGDYVNGVKEGRGQFWWTSGTYAGDKVPSMYYVITSKLEQGSEKGKKERVGGKNCLKCD